MAADAPLVTPYHPGDPIPVSLSGDDADESCGCWEMLSRSGHRLGAAGEAAIWGDEFGASWMVNLAEAPGRIRRRPAASRPHLANVGGVGRRPSRNRPGRLVTDAEHDGR
jgi:hypothetical protein